MGVKENVNVSFSATLGNSTQSTFKTMANGFKNMAKELRDTAKGLLDMQNTDAAEAVGHVAMAVDRMAQSFSKSKPHTQTTKKELDLLGKASEKFAGSSKLAQEAWEVFSKEAKNGSMALSTAASRANEYDKAISNLVADIKLVGGSSAQLSKEISFTGVAMRQQNNELKVSGGHFRNVSDDAYKYLVTNQNTVKALRELHSSQSLYNRALRESRAAKLDVGNVEAIQQLGKQTAYSTEKLRNMFPVLNKVESNLTRLKVAQKALTGTTASWASSVDRVSLVNQNLINSEKGVIQHVDMTAKGFKILSLEGLKPFGALTLDTAQKLGMLDNSYAKFVNEMSRYQIISGKTNAEMKNMRDQLLANGTSFTKATAGIKNYIDSAKRMSQQENIIDKLVQKYRELLATESKYTSEASKLLTQLRREPEAYNKVVESLRRLESQRKGDIQNKQKQTAAEIKHIATMDKLLFKYQELIVTNNRYASSAMQELDALRKKPALYNQVVESLKRMEKARLDDIKAEQRAAAASQANEDRVRKLVHKYQELIASGSAYRAESVRLLVELRNQPAAYDRVIESLKRLEKARIEEVNAAKKLQNALKDVTSKYAPLISSGTKYANAAQNIIRKLKEQKLSIVEAKNTLQILNNKYRDALRIQKQFKESTSVLSGAVERVGRSFKTYASYMMSSSLLRGFTSSVDLATRSIVEHDQALHDLRAIMQATTDEVRYMDAALLKVATDTKFSMTETGEAMKLLGQAGFTASEAIAGIPNIANLATGTLESLESTVNLVSTAVRVFDLGMDETAKVVDTFANATNSSRLTISKFNTAFNYVGPIAAEAGLSLTQTAQGMMVLANAGLRSSTIGTGFRRVLTQLLKPSKEFTEAVLKSGHSMNEFNPLLNDFNTIMFKMKDVVEDSQEAVEMFGTRGASVITAFSKAGAREMRRLSDSLMRSGTASKMAQEQMKGLEVTLKNIKDKFGVLADTIAGAGLRQSFTLMAHGFRDVLGVAIAFAQTGIGQVTLGLTSFVAIGGTGILTIAGLATAFTKVTPIVAGLTASTVEFLLRLTAVGPAATQAGAGMLVMNGSAVNLAASFKVLWANMLPFLTNPIVLAFAGTAAVVAAVTGGMELYRRKLADAYYEQLRYTEALERTADKFDAYTGAVKKYGTDSTRAREASASLSKSLVDLGKGYTNTGIDTEKYTDILDSNAESADKALEAMSDLEGILSGKLSQAYLKAYVASTELARQERLTQEHSISAYYDKAASAVGKFRNKVVEANEARRRERDERVAVIRFGKSKEAIEAEEAAKAFAELKKKAEEGQAWASDALDSFSKLSRSFIEEMVKQKDITNLTNEEIEKLVLSYNNVNTRLKDPAGIGFMVDALIDARDRIKDTQEAFAGIPKGAEYAFSFISDEIERITKDGKIKIGDLTKTIGYMAKNLGIENFEDLRKVVGTVFDTFEEGGTKSAIMKGAFSSLGITTEGLTKKFKEMAISLSILIRDASTEPKQLSDAFEKLAASAKNAADLDVLTSVFKEMTSELGLTEAQLEHLQSVITQTVSKIDTVFEAMSKRTKETNERISLMLENELMHQRKQVAELYGTGAAVLDKDVEEKRLATKVKFLKQQADVTTEYFREVSEKYRSDSSEYAQALSTKIAADKAYYDATIAQREAKIDRESITSVGEELAPIKAQKQYQAELIKVQEELTKLAAQEKTNAITNEEYRDRKLVAVRNHSAIELEAIQAEFVEKEKLANKELEIATMKGNTDGIRAARLELGKLEIERIAEETEKQQELKNAIAAVLAEYAKLDTRDQDLVDKQMNKIREATLKAEESKATDEAAKWEAKKARMAIQFEEELQMLRDHGANELEVKKAKEEQEKQLSVATKDADKSINQQRLGQYSQFTGAMTGVMGEFYESGLIKSKKFFEAYKAMQVAETIISTVASAQKAYASGLEMGGPYWGMALGIANAALATAQGMARVVMIKQQQYKYAYGGEIAGPRRGDRADNVTIQATPGEYMMDVPAVRYYGLPFMEAIRKRLLPKSYFSTMQPASETVKSQVPRTHYATGGSVTQQPNTGTQQEPPQIVNIIDPNLIEQFMNSSHGSRVQMNFISANAQAINRKLQQGG